MSKKIFGTLLGLYALSSVFLVASSTPILIPRHSESSNDVVLSPSHNIAVRNSPKPSSLVEEHVDQHFKRGGIWVVRQGDTGNQIAAQLGITFFQLAFMNPDVQWKLLQIGQTLNIPGEGDTRPYTVVSGDTGNAIAAANEITFAQLEAFNRNIDWYNLQIGQILIIPGLNMDSTRMMPTNNVVEAEQGADIPASSLELPTVSVDTQTIVITSTKSISPFLTPGETPSFSDSPTSQTFEVRQVARPVASPVFADTSMTTKYTIKAGDTGYAIATQYGIDFEALSRANPGVIWLNLQIGQVLNIPAAKAMTGVSLGDPVMPVTRSRTIQPSIFSSTSSNSVTRILPIPQSTTLTIPNIPTANAYITYTGPINGTQPAYPLMSTWLSFPQLWTRNSPNIGTSCVFSSGSVPPNTANETASLRSAILDVSSETSVHPSFILAMIMQESNGCVRAPTTSSWQGIQNPGLMQSFRGRASCNMNGQVQQPCPDTMIKLMVAEGVKGNQNVGLVPALQVAARSSGSSWPRNSMNSNINSNSNSNINTGAGGSTSSTGGQVAAQIQGSNGNNQAQGQGTIGRGGTSVNGGISGQKQIDEAMLYYQAARIYNSGSIPEDGDLSAKTGSTRCYVSDVVNRLMGWNGSGKTCYLV